MLLIGGGVLEVGPAAEAFLQVEGEERSAELGGRDRPLAGRARQEGQSARVGDVIELGGEPVWVPQGSRPLYHAALAFASNNLMTLVNQTSDLLAEAGIGDQQDDRRPAGLARDRVGLGRQEALLHGGFAHRLKVNTHWIEAQDLHWPECAQRLSRFDGILVPGGFGDRGTEGKIAAAKFARENGVPYYGLCLGLQIAVIEFARNVLKLKERFLEEN